MCTTCRETDGTHVQCTKTQVEHVYNVHKNGWCICTMYIATQEHMYNLQRNGWILCIMYREVDETCVYVQRNKWSKYVYCVLGNRCLNIV